MAGQTIPGPTCVSFGASPIDYGTNCRQSSSPVGVIVQDSSSPFTANLQNLLVGTDTIDASKFISEYTLSFGSPKDSAQTGIRALLGFFENDNDVRDIRWMAYMLATVRHECAMTYLPIEEYGKGAGREYGKKAKFMDAKGKQYEHVYYGRGYVQLTWLKNYLAVGIGLELGEILAIDPSAALEPNTAYLIMSYGMRNGTFTGVGIARYIIGEKVDYFNARKVINGLDCAQSIADAATKIEQVIRKSVVRVDQTASFSHGDYPVQRRV